MHQGDGRDLRSQFRPLALPPGSLPALQRLSLGPQFEPAPSPRLGQAAG